MPTPYIRYAVDDFLMSEMDYNQARFNMVEQQVRPWDVLDPRVLNVIGNIPRELFTPEDCKQLAYADTRIPIGEYEGRTSHMLKPVIEGRMLQSLAITDHPNSVLSLAWHAASKRIGTGCFDGTVSLWNLEDGALLKRFVAIPPGDEAAR